MSNFVLDEDFDQLYNETKQILSLLKGKHILVSGATGLITMYLTKFLIHLNKYYNFQINVYLIARNEKKLKEKYEGILGSPNVVVLIQDVCDKIAISDPIDYIIHAAGSADPTNIVTNPVGIWKANILGTINLCDVAREKNSEILFLSTREIYGQRQEEISQLKEDTYGALDPLQSRSCYPMSKLCAEAMLTSYKEQYNVNYKIVRIAHTYGPGMAIDNDGRIMADLMQALVHQRPFVLKSDGQMKRSFCYISDCIKAMLYVVVKGKNCEAYNIANESEEIRVVDLAKLMAEMAGTEVIFEKANEVKTKGYLQIKRISLDTSKLEVLGWKPTVQLKDGIMRTKQSMKSNK